MGAAKKILWAAALSFSFSNHVIAGGEGSKIAETEWELTKTPNGNFYRLITHGEAVWGHEIGALFPVADCDTPILWVSWSSIDDRLNETAEGTVTTFAFASSGQRVQDSISRRGKETDWSVRTACELRTNGRAPPKVRSWG